MFHRRPLLPQVPIYGFIGGIPETFGGRTSVCLQRANAFAEIDDRRVEILTLSPKHATDPESLTARLRQEGRIGDKVEIRNVWADIRRATDEQLRRLTANVASLAEPRTGPLLPYNGEPESHKISAEGKTLQVDRFRDDGSRVYSYRNASQVDGVLSPRTATVFDVSGEIVGQWDQQYHLYFAWMDWVIGAGPAVLINDGPPLAKYLHQYRRDGIVFVQAIHSRHSSTPKSAAGLLSSTYLPTLKQMDKFDRVAVLTEAQQKDVLQHGYAVDNLVVQPNMFVAQPAKRISPRERGAGVMLARLTHQKRINHAIEAVHRVIEKEASVSLDVYGVLDEAEASLLKLIDELGLTGSVRLQGYDPRAKSKFEESSFTLLTSEYEGQPLVLLEAMSMGCIPISYDLEYGPSDIITDGLNGFLVPAGDVDALAERILMFSSMSERDVRAMRKAAVRRAKDFTPRVITGRWGAMLSEALKSKSPVKEIKGRAELISLSADSGLLRVRLSVTGPAANSPRWGMLTWEQRKGRGYGRVPAHLESSEDSMVASSQLSVSSFSRYLSGNVDFWLDLRVDGNPVRLRVKGLSAGTEIAAGPAVLYGTTFGSLSARPASAKDS